MAVLEHNNSSSFSLFDACSYNASLSEKDYFVGIKYENESLRINFPLGYKRASTEEELKKDVLNLIGVLSSLSDANESFIWFGEKSEKCRRRKRPNPHEERFFPFFDSTPF